MSKTRHGIRGVSECNHGYTEKPFWHEFDSMVQADILQAHPGNMGGTMSNESWRAFLKTIRDEALDRLQSYREETYTVQGFRASSLQPYFEARKKIEREYVRNLVDLYCSAERAYKTLSG